MQTYAVFGASGDLHPGVKTELLEDPIPDSEVHGGVYSILVRSYGDSIDEAYIQVDGVDRKAAVSTWKRVRDLLAVLTFWPTEEGK